MIKQLTLVSRLTILYAAISAVVLFGLGLMVARASYLHFVELDLAYLESKAAVVQRNLSTVSDPAEIGQLLAQQMEGHDDLYIAIDDGKLPNPTVRGIDFSRLSAALVQAGEIHDWQTNGITLRGIKAPLSNGRVLLLGVNMYHHAHFMTELHYKLAVYLFGATILSGLLGWWGARRGLAPLRVMRERARNIDARQLNVRMPIEGSSVELAELAQGLNLMLGRLERDFERISEFSSDIAHELRTPITNLMTQTQVILARQRETQSYRETLESNMEEFQRLARMVSDMLYLAKTEHGLEPPNREPLSLAYEVRALFDFYEAIAEDADIRLLLEGEETVIGDRLMVRRAISNILSNALRHAFKGSVIVVRITSVTDAVELTVTNKGHPIDSAVIPRLFDRFYRTQKSRPHPEHSGTGLGLSITKSLMSAHGGTIKVYSDTEGTRFTLIFPFVA
jgi:two-component system heavy metal sensor histidine kinase CusS